VVVPRIGRYRTDPPVRDGHTAIRLLTAKTPLVVAWIEPEDIAPVMMFLASDKARITSATTRFVIKNAR
jgi:hypothetical protein